MVETSIPSIFDPLILVAEHLFIVNPNRHVNTLGYFNV